jgi:hypothetical protein
LGYDPPVDSWKSGNLAIRRFFLSLRQLNWNVYDPGVIIISDYNAIRDTGRSLIKLIWENVSSDLPWRKNTGIDSDAQIVLSSPEAAGEQHKLSIYLYRIEEDTYLKNPGWEDIDGDKSRAARIRGPTMNLRLFYMITPLAKDDEINHIILGRLVQITNDNPVLRSPSLQGSLAGSELKLIFSPLSIDDMNKIWGIITKSKSCMPSLYYEISGLGIESSRMTELGRVAEIEPRVVQKDEGKV